MGCTQGDGGGGGGKYDGEGGGGGSTAAAAAAAADILSHPLYEQLLSVHVACLRIATPVDQLPRIDAHLAQSQQVVAKYSVLGHGHPLDDKDLDHFMDIKKERWVLAEEGELYAKDGSPEAQLFLAVPPEGIAREALQIMEVWDNHL